jgi:hypothetical protein
VHAWFRVWPAAALLALGCPACSGGGSAEPDADTTDAPPSCEEVDQGTAFDLRFGLATETGEFDELSDGDDCPLVVGTQGILMMIGELRAGLADPPRGASSMCCTARVGPSGSFDGATQSAPVPVEDNGDELAAYALVLLTSADMADTLDGAEVSVAWSCADAAGAAGSVDLSLRFIIPPE